MLDILKKLDVHNACVVVTRYFGGIKLGGGGLIRAIAVLLETSFMMSGIYENYEKQYHV